MRTHLSRLSYANVMATIAVFIALGGGAFAAVKSIPGKDGTISGCFKNKGGKLRVVGEGAKCKKGESALSWNQKGATGATGSPGTAGSNASINGVAAGGDLSGTYPNPAIAAGAVSPTALETLPAARVTRTSSQSIPTSSTTSISFNSEVYDTASMHSNSTNPTRITAPIAGMYVIAGNALWQTTGAGLRSISLRVNGGGSPIAKELGPFSSTGVEQNVSTTFTLSAGDYVELTADQDADGSINILQSDFDTPILTMNWIGPSP